MRKARVFRVSREDEVIAESGKFPQRKLEPAHASPTAVTEGDSLAPELLGRLDRQCPRLPVESRRDPGVGRQWWAARQRTCRIAIARNSTRAVRERRGARCARP